MPPEKGKLKAPGQDSPLKKVLTSPVNGGGKGLIPSNSFKTRDSVPKVEKTLPSNQVKKTFSTDMDAMKKVEKPSGKLKRK